MNPSAGGQASKSVAPSPTKTKFLKSYVFFKYSITMPFPPLLEVGWFSSIPANSPKKYLIVNLF